VRGRAPPSTSIEHVRIHHRGRHAAMAQKLLHRANVVSALEKMGREAGEGSGSSPSNRSSNRRACGAWLDKTPPLTSPSGATPDPTSKSHDRWGEFSRDARPSSEGPTPAKQHSYDARHPNANRAAPPPERVSRSVCPTIEFAAPPIQRPNSAFHKQKGLSPRGGMARWRGLSRLLTC
jgi:hypothetical protein